MQPNELDAHKHRHSATAKEQVDWQCEWYTIDCDVVVVVVVAVVFRAFAFALALHCMLCRTVCSCTHINFLRSSVCMQRTCEVKINLCAQINGWAARKLYATVCRKTVICYLLCKCAHIFNKLWIIPFRSIPRVCMLCVCGRLTMHKEKIYRAYHCASPTKCIFIVLNEHFHSFATIFLSFLSFFSRKISVSTPFFSAPTGMNISAAKQT